MLTLLFSKSHYIDSKWVDVLMSSSCPLYFLWLRFVIIPISSLLMGLKKKCSKKNDSKSTMRQSISVNTVCVGSGVARNLLWEGSTLGVWDYNPKKEGGSWDPSPENFVNLSSLKHYFRLQYFWESKLYKRLILKVII